MHRTHLTLHLNSSDILNNSIMGNDIQHKTTVNIQEKANLIWAIADKLVGVYKPHEYGNVILPMCVIKRFENVLRTP